MKVSTLSGMNIWHSAIQDFGVLNKNLQSVPRPPLWWVTENFHTNLDCKLTVALLYHIATNFTQIMLQLILDFHSLKDQATNSKTTTKLPNNTLETKLNTALERATLKKILLPLADFKTWDFKKESCQFPFYLPLDFNLGIGKNIDT